MGQRYKAALFDLDGVIVDTAKYHYTAWKRLAEQLEIDFTEADNERLKGVSRMDSLDIILELGQITLDPAKKAALADQKNDWYLEYIHRMTPEEILPGAKEYIADLRERNVKIALCSASKNAELILKRMEIERLFDAVIDGNQVAKTKPDPEVFLLGAQAVGVLPEECVVFEDSEAGIRAAVSCGMYTVGIGLRDNLKEAAVVVPGLDQIGEGISLW